MNPLLCNNNDGNKRVGGYEAYHHHHHHHEIEAMIIIPEYMCPPSFHNIVAHPQSNIMIELKACHDDVDIVSCLRKQQQQNQSVGRSRQHSNNNYNKNTTKKNRYQIKRQSAPLQSSQQRKQQHQHHHVLQNIMIVLRLLFNTTLQLIITIPFKTTKQQFSLFIYFILFLFSNTTPIIIVEGGPTLKNNNILSSQNQDQYHRQHHEALQLPEKRFIQESVEITSTDFFDINDVDDNYYYETTLGEINITASIGNPLKGFSVDPNLVVTYPYRVLTSLESFYIGLDNVLMFDNVYNWSNFEKRLNDTASRNCHSIPRFFIHYPGEVLRLPYDILDQIELREYTNHQGTDKGLSPYYGDSILLNVIQNFIIEFGNKYDGDERIGYIQLGILGFWGEWHDSGNDFIPDDVPDQLVLWYSNAFTKTKLQIRNPRSTAITSKMGYHDDSFAFSTLDGIYNDNITSVFYFWSRIIANNNTEFYKYGPMGGEIRPELKDIILKPNYPANTYNHQDLITCINITHTTYLRHVWLYRDANDDITKNEYERAIYVSSSMGYNFYIKQLKVSESIILLNHVNIHIDIEQIGIAPFYYPLNVILNCLLNDYENHTSVIKDIDQVLINQYDNQLYTFINIPVTELCLSTISIALQSDMVYNNVPIRWAQGNGMHVNITVPLPFVSQIDMDDNAILPTIAPPTLVPTIAPTIIPTIIPTITPTLITTLAPTFIPTSAPTLIPTSAPTQEYINNNMVIIINNNNRDDYDNITTGTMIFTLVDARTDTDMGLIESGDNVLLPIADDTIRNDEILLSIRVEVIQLCYIQFAWMNNDINQTKRSKYLSYTYAMDGDIMNNISNETTVDDEYYAIPYLSKIGIKNITVTAIGEDSLNTILQQETLTFIVMDSTPSQQPQEEDEGTKSFEITRATIAPTKQELEEATIITSTPSSSLLSSSSNKSFSVILCPITMMILMMTSSSMLWLTFILVV